ncbi:N-chimaerin [Desmophyllum pertusum]|uniref:Beta-chimaerin n=1 Tax=Desmophyllum pertusum TaxID=174260 RepID=A0A9W9Z5Q0_9CNID|nr:N-chimaerin [Desmophyllum pertusum]
MTEEPAEEGRFYDTIEQPVWEIVPFHGCISREEADDLVSEGDGGYLVRESQRSPGSYTLTMRFGGVSKNFRLYYDGLHYVGEKRFQTIQDLVADGLITMYIDTYAKDYVDTMMINASGKDQDQRVSIGRRESVKPSAYKKHHNFKIYTFKGPHWCDFCRNFLWGLIMQGVKCQDCGFNAHKQCSAVIPDNCQPDKKYVRRVFGVDLTTLVKLHNTKRPFLVEACIKEVEKRGLDSEGIYRISGFADDVEALKNSFDKDGESVNLTVYDDINIISGALKLYFRMLPIPVITFELYNKFIDATKLSGRVEKVEALSAALLELPPSHYETLKYLLGHLYRVVKRKKKT